jgi:hypothetical protein
MDHGTNGKQQLPFVFSKQKKANLRLFAANENAKQTLVFLGRQKINGTVCFSKRAHL